MKELAIVTSFVLMPLTALMYIKSLNTDIPADQGNIQIGNCQKICFRFLASLLIKNCCST